MRLDKFLKNSRIIKRRTVAKEVCDYERVLINGRIAKAGTDIKEGDTLNINLGRKRLEVKVLATPDNVRANMAKEIYEIIKEENINIIKNL